MKKSGPRRRYMVRYRVCGNDELFFQRKKRHILSWIPLPIPLWMLGVGWVARDWLLLNAPINVIDNMIIKKLDDIQELLVQRKNQERMLQASKDDVKKSGRITQGYSDWFPVYLSKEDIRDMSTHTPKPPDKWKQFLNPKIFKDLGAKQDPSLREQVFPDGMQEPRSGRTAYTTKEMAKYAEYLVGEEVDHVVAYDDDRRGRGNNNQNQGNKQKGQQHDPNKQPLGSWDDRTK